MRRNVRTLVHSLVLISVCVAVFAQGPAGSPSATALQPTYNGLTGYFNVSPDASRDIRNDGWGMSMYSAVYPLKPGKDDWTQLGWGTWILPNPYEDENGVWNPAPKNDDGSWKSLCSPGAPLPNNFQSNEGGVGTWGDVKFPVAAPMFIVGATADCYASNVGSPAYISGGGRALDPKSLYFAQVSNRVLLPPGPVVFRNPDQPSLFGYGWIALPIIPANASPYGIPTGQNSWTLFFNAANYKGAVGFYTPAYWTAVNEGQDPWLSVGYGLDTRNNAGGSLAMEVGFTNAFTATDGGVEYRRVPRLTFGLDGDRRATLVQDFKRYFKGAIWNQFAAWVDGGPPPARMEPSGIWNSTMTQPAESLRMLDGSGIDLGTTVKTTVFTTAGGGSAFGLQWDGSLEPGVLPEYYKKAGDRWTPIPASQVPTGTALSSQTFPRLPLGTTPGVDTTSTSPWAPSHWAAGPFRTSLGNRSIVEYVWYRFIDQPAIARLPLNEAERAKLQAWAESLHDLGTDGLTIPPPSSGQLVSLDAGLLVVPPPGLERGYVPIAIGQDAAPGRVRGIRR